MSEQKVEESSVNKLTENTVEEPEDNVDVGGKSKHLPPHPSEEEDNVDNDYKPLEIPPVDDSKEEKVEKQEVKKIVKRGRPRLTEEQKEAKREKARIAARERRAKNKVPETEEQKKKRYEARLKNLVKGRDKLMQKFEGLKVEEKKETLHEKPSPQRQEDNEDDDIDSEEELVIQKVRKSRNPITREKKSEKKKVKIESPSELEILKKELKEMKQKLEEVGGDDKSPPRPRKEKEVPKHSTRKTSGDVDYFKAMTTARVRR